MLIVYSFMEGARLQSSVALPREVAKDTELEDNGKKLNLKAGQQIMCNLVWSSELSFKKHMSKNAD